MLIVCKQKLRMLYKFGAVSMDLNSFMPAFCANQCIYALRPAGACAIKIKL